MMQTNHLVLANTLSWLYNYKKSELMLMQCVRAYSSSCSQVG